jgi:PAS domain S-box-containing protein
MPMNWERVFDAITEGLIAFDHDGAFVYANRAGAAAFGTTPAGLAGRRLADFSEPEGTASLAGVIAHCFDDERPAEAEVYLPIIQRWQAVRSYPTESGVTVFLQDITDKKIAEDLLRVSEAKFAGIFSISADAIISVDSEQRIIHFNRGAEEIFGWSAAELIGDTLDKLIPARFRPGHGEHIRNFAKSSIDARRMGERREISGLRRNGEEFPAEASISKLSVGDQRIFTVVLRDVTERKLREENYRRLYEEAQRAVAARDDVLSFVSHDLGNPLAAIRVASAVLMRRMDADSPEHPHVLGIREAVEQAQRLIRDLLDIQKAEAGKLVLHFEQVDVDQLIAEAINALRPLIDEKEVRIAREVAPETLFVAGDHDRLMQVLANLIGNAVKFSPAGGVVTISAVQEGAEVVVAIRDEGPGIAQDELPHIFDRYFQAKQSGKVGHGLGLSIVQAISRAHNGRAWAESTLGAGATFFVALPATPA